MTARVRVAIVATVFASAAGCGQQGPLVLPREAQPIDRVEPAAAEPGDSQDEDTDER